MSRGKDRHKIKYPGSASINLDEAIDLMNKITAEEGRLTEDTISVEQCIQNLTLTATPMVSQYSTPQSPTHSTCTPQSEGRSFPHGGAISKSGNRGGKGWSNNNAPLELHCHVCESNDHNSSQCPRFTTPSARRVELRRINKCPECAFKIKPGNSHLCPLHMTCNCGGYHRKWLCTEKNNSSAVSHGQNTSLTASTTVSQNNSFPP